MTPAPSIRYLLQKDIDRSKWDRCIDGAANGLIYGYSFYLDTLASHWDALVLGDYEAVMPLPWRKKWGLSYIYQPFLTAQSGLFGNGLTAELIADFLAAIPGHFRLIEYPLNRGNLPAPAGFGVYMRMNYVLDLSAGYEELQKNYRDQTKRNIRKSEKYGCVLKKKVSVREVLSLAMSNASGIDPGDVNNFEKLYYFLSDRKQAVTYGIASKNGELLASCVFFFSHARAYYILVGNHPNGRTLGASHALIDAFIRDHAGENIKLDFEGSDLRNLAFFYSSFGAHEEPYPAIKLNRLPWWARMLKK